MAARSDWGDTKLVSPGAKQRWPDPRLGSQRGPATGGRGQPGPRGSGEGHTWPGDAGDRRNPGPALAGVESPTSVIEAGFLLAAYVVKLQEVWDELPTVPEPTVAGDPPSEP